MREGRNIIHAITEILGKPSLPTLLSSENKPIFYFLGRDILYEEVDFADKIL